MNVDDMTDEEFIDYCRNGGELSGLITERHPKCDWCGGMCRVGKDGMCRNCRIRERRDGSKPGLWSVYWYLGWDMFCSFSLAVGITSKNTMMAIVQAFCLLVFLGLTVWQLNHLTWSITDYRVRISSNLEKGAHVEQSEK